MRDRPSGADLVALAAELAAPGDEELIERCRAIAAREARTGNAGWPDWHAASQAVYGDVDGSAGGWETLSRRLASDIRAGTFDTPGGARDAVRALLRQVTLRKLSDANPEFVGDPEAAAETVPRRRV